MYEYRKMTEDQRVAVVETRQRRGYPWHQPPHPETEAPTYRMVTAACFEHACRLDSPERLEWFERELLGCLQSTGSDCAAWVVLPNHYHVLVRITAFAQFATALG